MARVKLRIVRAQQHIPGGRAKEVGPPPSPTARKHLARCTHAQTLRDRGDAVAKRARCYMCSYAFTRGMRCPALTSGVFFFISQLAVFTVLSPNSFPQTAAFFSSFVRFFFREVCVQCMLALLTSHRRELGCNTLDARRDGRWVRSTCYARGTHVASTPL